MNDERPIEVQKEYPLREFPLGVCVCSHGNEDHVIDLGQFGIKDGMCELCVCKEFRHAHRGNKIGQ